MPRINKELFVTFESNDDAFPTYQEGPFIWVEMIGNHLYGCPQEGKKVEIAGANEDGSWDAGPSGEHRSYDRWVIG